MFEYASAGHTIGLMKEEQLGVVGSKLVDTSETHPDGGLLGKWRLEGGGGGGGGGMGCFEGRRDERNWERDSEVAIAMACGFVY